MLVEISIQCPFCGEEINSMVDTSQGGYSTIEDCQVCCRPMEISVECEPGEVHSIDVQPG